MSKYKQDIIRLRKQGKSYRQIEDELGCSKGTVAYNCKQAGLEDIGKKQQKISKEKKEKINTLRKNGQKVKNVAEKLNISESSVVIYTTEETKNHLKKEPEAKKSQTKEEFVGSKYHKGLLAEEKVRSKVIELGYKVYEPVVRSVEDLLIEASNDFLKLQIKNGNYKNDCVVANLERGGNTYNQNVNKSGPYHEDDIDLFAIYCLETDKVYGVEFSNAPKRGIHLRVEDPKRNTGNIRWAKNYDIENLLQ